MDPTLLTGAYEHAIDAKNRLSIPAQIRNEMDPERDGTRFYLVPGARPGTLSLYPEKTFRRRQESWPSPEIPNEDLLNFNQVFFSMATLLDLDKQGRVLLPDRPVKAAAIRREVYITGAGDHLDLWNKSDYESFLDANWSRYAEVQHRARKYFSKRTSAEDEA